MKIWFDILTPKQLLFFEHFIDRLNKKGTTILCTSRRYSEVSRLAKIRKVKLRYIGKHGGAKREEKLKSSIERMALLQRTILREKPDVLVSFCSPEASRVAFGLGIRHIAFSDSPHASAVMRLSVPLVQKLLIPWIIPKREFEKFGISAKDIIQYRSIDAAVTIKRKASSSKVSFAKKTSGKKNIVIRVTEDQASYTRQKDSAHDTIQSIIENFGNHNVIILARYEEQLRSLRNLGKKARVLKMSHDGKDILEQTDVFVGSGGTMTAESALLGVPTISYNAVPNRVESFLVKQKLIVRETNPKRIVKQIREISHRKETRKRAKKLVASFEDPSKILAKMVSP